MNARRHFVLSGPRPVPGRSALGTKANGCWLGTARYRCCCCDRGPVAVRSAGVLTASGRFVAQISKSAERASFLALRVWKPATQQVWKPALRAAAAFSLIEMMVAVTLLAVIIVGLLAMFYQTQRAFRAGLAQVDVLEGGRAAMELIVRELQEAAISSDTPITNIEVRPSTSPLYQPLQLDLPTADVRAFLQDVTFIRKVNDEWFVESYQVSNVVAGVGTLYRLFPPATGRTNVANLLEKVRATAIGTNTPMAANFTRVAEGIVHFRVLPFDSNGTLISSNYPGIVSNRVQPLDQWYYAFSSNRVPSFVDIELAVLEPKSVEQVRTRANNLAKALEYLRKQPGRMHFFKQRVALRNASYFSVTNVP